MEGWIKIYRDITKHWIFKNEYYLKAWIIILLKVNYEDNKILIESEVIECKRGQSLLSLQGWTKLFGNKWTIQKTRTFFNLLKNDSMINTEGLRKTTRLTVCNYDYYQNVQQADNKQTTSRQQADNKQITTIKKDKKDNNDKKVKEESFDFSFIKEEWKDVFNRWIDYKKSRKEMYKTQASLEACYRNLLLYSSNDIKIAEKIIDQSEGNQWKGIFPLKEFNKPKSNDVKFKF